MVLRHRTRDIEIFDEIFVGISSYEPPPAVAMLLRDSPPNRVLDLGGNVGLFGVYALASWPTATITSVEPDPRNIRLLIRCVEANRATAGWKVITACAACQPGVVAFAGGRFADSAIAVSGERATDHVGAIDALELLREADFTKIDIEGGEWDVLLDPRFPAVAPAVLAMEWHEHRCPTEDAYLTVLSVLHQAGYAVHAPRPGLGYDYGLVWAWRPRLPGVGSGACLYARDVTSRGDPPSDHLREVGQA